MIEALIEAVRGRQVLVFAGAGISKPLGLPSWGELINEMATQVGFDPDIFSTHGDYMQLAEYYRIQKTTLGPLRSWMDVRWHHTEERVDGSEIHQALVDMDAPLIYTTNYDRWIEIAFRRRGKPFLKVANVGDFVHIREGLPQIVKFHGDFDDDDSLVLTETSYLERLAFESPLDIKFRADCLGRTILFIGYSLTDTNMRYLMHKLHRAWSKSVFHAARPKSYIFLTKPNPVQQAILQERGIFPVVSDAENPTTGLVSFLRRLIG